MYMCSMIHLGIMTKFCGKLLRLYTVRFVSRHNRLASVDEKLFYACHMKGGISSHVACKQDSVLLN